MIQQDSFERPLQEAPPAPAKLSEAASGQAREFAETLKETTGEALESAKSAGLGLAEQQKEKLANRLDHYTDAIKAAAEKLHSDEENPLAGPAEKASRQLERAAGYLHRTPPREMVNDLGDFARRRPELVFGTLFVAGLAAVRFLKASTTRDRSTPRRRSKPSRRSQRPDDQDALEDFTPPRATPVAAPAPLGPPPAYQTQYPATP